MYVCRKVAGNYAADLLPNMLGKKKGFPIGLYLVRRSSLRFALT
jgi:hypothetical protein